AIPEDFGEFEDLGLAGSQKLLAGEFGRGPQIPRHTAAVGPGELGPRRMQMGLITRRNLQNPGLDLDKSLLGKPCPQGAGNRAPRIQKWSNIGMTRSRPPR